MPSVHVIGLTLNQSKMVDEIMGKTHTRTRGVSGWFQVCVAKNSSLLPASTTK